MKAEDINLQLSILKMDFLIFGDQSTETFEALCSPSFSNSPVVRVFIKEVDTVIRRQISLLPRLTKDLLPDILLSQESFENCGKWPKSDPVLRPILTTISQFVEFFGFVNTSHPTMLDQTDHQQQIRGCQRR